MLFIVLIASISVLVTSTTAQGNKFQEFRNENKDTVDYSSLTTCFFLGGKKIDMVQPGNKDKGYKCTITLSGWSKDEKQAQQFCESRLPYYVIDSKPGISTTCTFQINVNCELNGFWQIHGKCYKATPSKHNGAEAQKMCGDTFSSSDITAKLADYYSSSLKNYLNDMTFSDAWINVPNLADYYANGEGTTIGVFVQDGSHKYDTKEGSILMDDENVKHQVLCEYTAPLTMAEMYYIAEIYSEVYPINVHDDGAIIPSSSFMTVKQTSITQQFSPQKLEDRCLSIGMILNVKSYPMTALEEEFNDVKDSLTHFRFYLTNAYKNEGCLRMNYRQHNADKTEFQVFKSTEPGNNVQMCDAHSFSLHKKGRFPTMAAMRAPVLCTLHTFNWDFGQCPPGPAWSTPPIRFIRDDNRVFCHYVNNRHIVEHDVAKQMCMDNGLGASLSGFDSEKELREVLSHVKPENKKLGNSVDSHYRLGGVCPCKTDCYPGGNQEKYIASWNDGVGVNTHFLNTYNGGIYMDRFTGDRYVSFREDNDKFHVHPLDQYHLMFFVCGKTAPLVRTERHRGGLANKAG